MGSLGPKSYIIGLWAQKPYVMGSLGPKALECESAGKGSAQSLPFRSVGFPHERVPVSVLVRACVRVPHGFCRGFLCQVPRQGLGFRGLGFRV